VDEKNARCSFVLVLSLSIIIIFSFLRLQHTQQTTANSGKLTENELNIFFQKYPQAIRNETWLEFAQYWHKNPNISAQLLGINEGCVDETVNVLVDVLPDKDLKPISHQDFSSFVNAQKITQIIFSQDEEIRPEIMLKYYLIWFTEIWPNCGEDYASLINRYWTDDNSSLSSYFYSKGFSLYYTLVDLNKSSHEFYPTSVNIMSLTGWMRGLSMEQVLFVYPSADILHEDCFAVLRSDQLEELKNDEEFGTPIEFPGFPSQLVAPFSCESAIKDGITSIIATIDGEKIVIKIK
jgi:hypothetical protein